MKPETWKKLDKLFADTRADVGRSLVVAEDQPREEEILAAEHQLGCIFDQDYVDFLRRYGGATVGSMPVFGLRPVEVMGIPWSVVDVTLEYRSQQWPGTQDWYVVSDDGFGNPIGINREGHVMISDHDAGEIGELVANFEEFLLEHCLRRTS